MGTGGGGSVRTQGLRGLEGWLDVSRAYVLWNYSPYYDLRHLRCVNSTLFRFTLLILTSCMQRIWKDPASVETAPLRRARHAAQARPLRAVFSGLPLAFPAAPRPFDATLRRWCFRVRGVTLPHSLGPGQSCGLTLRLLACSPAVGACAGGVPGAVSGRCAAHARSKDFGHDQSSLWVPQMVSVCPKMSIVSRVWA